MVTRMLKSFCKLMFLSVFMSTVLVAQNTYAQPIEALSAREFSEKYLPEALIVFDGGNPKIMCGERKRLCDANTQVCLRCRTEHWVKWFGFKTLSNIDDEGRCVDKSSVDTTDPESILSAWPGCSNYRDGSKFLVRDALEKRNLTYEPAGFVTETETKVFGIGTEHKEEFKGSDKKIYMLAVDNGNMTIAYGEKGQGCEILPIKIYNMQKCFFCPMTQILFKTINAITQSSFENFGDSFAELMVAIFVVWLAILTLKQVFKFTRFDIADYLELVVKQSFKFLIAYYILLNSTFLFQYFVSPILSSGLRMGEMIQSAELVQPAKKMETSNVVMGSKYYNVRLANGKTLYNHIESYLSSIQAQMAYLQSVGTSLFCVGAKHMIEEFSLFKDFGTSIVDGFRMMILGIILTVVGILLSVVFAFYFLDAVMQLGLLGMLMPLMIAGWPFAITKHLAEKGFGFLLNTFFIFFFTGFVVSVNVVLIDQSLTYSAEVKAEESGSTANKNDSEGGLSAITKALHEQDAQGLADATKIGGMGFLLLIFSSLFGFKFIKEVSPLAGELSGGAIVGGMASRMGGYAGSVAKGMAVKATKPVTDAASKAVGNAGAKAVGLAGSAISGAAGAIGKAGKGALNFGKDVRSAAKSGSGEKGS